MRPNRSDHDDALRACQKITSAGKREEMDDAIVLLNIVAGAWACNDMSMCAHIGRNEFDAALRAAGNNEENND